jgi:hypothetical protein
LFLEYEFSRNDELLTPWLAGQNAIDPDPLGAEVGKERSGLNSLVRKAN